MDEQEFIAAMNIFLGGLGVSIEPDQDVLDRLDSIQVIVALEHAERLMTAKLPFDGQREVLTLRTMHRQLIKEPRA